MDVQLGCFASVVVGGKFSLKRKILLKKHFSSLKFSTNCATELKHLRDVPTICFTAITEDAGSAVPEACVKLKLV